MANFTLERVKTIYKKYEEAYKLAVDAGENLTSIDSFQTVQAVLNNPANSIYKTMADGQIVNMLIEGNKKIAYNPAGPLTTLVNLMTPEYLAEWEQKVSAMPDGEDKDTQKEVIEDLKNIGEMFEDMKQKMINDESYRKAVADAIWDLTQDSRLVHIIYSPQDAEDGEFEAGIVKGLISQK